MSKINKNLRKIDRYTLSLLVLALSMFNCTNSDNTNINSKNDLLLGKGDKDKKDKKEDKEEDIQTDTKKDKTNTNINGHLYDRIDIDDKDIKEYIEIIDDENAIKKGGYYDIRVVLKNNLKMRKIGDREIYYFDETEKDNIKKYFLENVINSDFIKRTNKCTKTKIFLNIFKTNPENIEVILYLKKNITDMSYMFSGCNLLTSIDLSNFDISKVTNMRYMFSGCINLKEISGISKWSTNMYGMFYGCSNLSLTIQGGPNMKDILNIFRDLKSLTIKGNINKVKNMSYMFSGCKSLKNIIFDGNVNTDNVEDMSGMFSGCESLESLKSLPDISNWNTECVTNMSYMFYNCSSLISLPDISKWDTSNVTNMCGMFENCSSLKELPNISRCDGKIESNNIFSNIKSKYILKLIAKIAENIGGYKWLDVIKYNKYLQKRLDIGIDDYKKAYILKLVILVSKEKYDKFIEQLKKNIDQMDDTKDIKHMIYKEKKQIIIYKNENSIDTFKIHMNNTTNNICQDKGGQIVIKMGIDPEITSLKGLFQDCKQITEITITGGHNVKDMSYMFSGCESLRLADMSKCNTINVTNMEGVFRGCFSLISLPDISKWDTSNVTNMSNMFNDCKDLKKLPDISKWNTNNVTNMSLMFAGCKSLKELSDISKWNTNNVTNMSYMFSGCSSLKSLPDISKWDINNVKDMSYMFAGCSSLISLPDISQWQTSKVQNMSYMFHHCKSLISLPNISKWNTSNVTDMSCIFCFCTSLILLPDISKWYTKNVKNMYSMFYNCSSLVSLPDISKWNTNKVKDMKGMFDGCINSINIPQMVQKTFILKKPLI